MARIPAENYLDKSIHVSCIDGNLLHHLSENATCSQDKESSDYSFNNSIIEKFRPNHNYQEPQIGFRQQWKTNQNRVSFEDERDSLENSVRDDIKQKQNDRKDTFLQRVNILKQKLHIIDDYKVNTEIYEKSKHLIDLDSLEVQHRRSPCPAPKHIEKENLNCQKEENKYNLKIDPKTINCTFKDKEFNREKTQTHFNGSCVNYGFTTNAEDFSNFIVKNQGSKTVVVIENTRTPTGTQSQFFRSILQENKFDPDSIDGHDWDAKVYHDNDIETRDQSVQEEHRIEPNEESCQSGRGASIDVKTSNTSINNTEVILEPANEDENGRAQIEVTNPTLSDGELSVNEDTCHIYEPMSLSNVDNQETVKLGDSHASPSVETITKITETPNTSAEQNFVKFKAKRFLQKKLSMKENEILQVLAEVKENDEKDRKQNKTSSYDLSSPELSSGQSSTRSLLESSTPGRENWRLRESDRSKSSSSRKYH